MLDEKMNEYDKKFNESFPTYPLLMEKTEDEVIKIIDECLTKNKDVYELGYLEDDNGILY